MDSIWFAKHSSVDLSALLSEYNTLTATATELIPSCLPSFGLADYHVDLAVPIVDEGISSSAVTTSSSPSSLQTYLPQLGLAEGRCSWS